MRAARRCRRNPACSSTSLHHHLSSRSNRLLLSGDIIPDYVSILTRARSWKSTQSILRLRWSRKAFCTIRQKKRGIEATPILSAAKCCQHLHLIYQFMADDHLAPSARSTSCIKLISHPALTVNSAAIIPTLDRVTPTRYGQANSPVPPSFVFCSVVRGVARSLCADA